MSQHDLEHLSFLHVSEWDINPCTYLYVDNKDISKEFAAFNDASKCLICVRGPKYPTPKNRKTMKWPLRGTSGPKCPPPIAGWLNDTPQVTVKYSFLYCRNTVLSGMRVGQDSSGDGSIALLKDDVFCSAQKRVPSKERRRGFDLRIGKHHR